MRASSITVAAAALIVATGTLAACGGRPDTPEGAFRAYLDAYNDHDCARVEALVTPDAEVGESGRCAGFLHVTDLYMLDRVVTDQRSDEAELTVQFEQGMCRIAMRRSDDAWLLHDQACLGTRPDGAVFDLDYR